MSPRESPAAQLEELFSLSLTDSEREGLRRFIDLLRHWGQRINLAGPALLADPYPHLLEAIWASRRAGLRQPGRIVDVGSGCGVPGIVLAIAEPRNAVTLLERNQKKAVFLQECARQMELQVQVFNRSFEEFQEWDSHDLATLRALKPAPALLGALHQAKLPLLWFRGGSSSSRLPGFALDREERVPGSEQRWLSRFVATQSNVSRETGNPGAPLPK